MITLGNTFRHLSLSVLIIIIEEERTIMIGDRLTTDIVFGRTNGLRTLFVQSGIGSAPHFYLRSFDDKNKFI